MRLLHIPALACASLLALAPLFDEGAQEQAPVPQTQGTSRSLRFVDPSAKKELVGKDGYEAIQGGLAWLVSRQSPDGFWTTTGEPGSPSPPSANATSLALLALVGDGNTTRSGKYKLQVSRASTWLQNRVLFQATPRQLATGIYAIADLRKFDAEVISLEKLEGGLTALLGMRNLDGVWNSTSEEISGALTSSWCTAALVSSAQAGATVEHSDLQVIGSWLLALVDRSGYVRLESPSGAMEHGTAVVLLPRLLLMSEVHDSSLIEKQLERLSLGDALPEWEQDDLEYWYAASSSLQLAASEHAPTFYAALRTMLLDNQLRGGSDSGSWTGVGYAPEQGMVRSTAMAVLALEAPYRLRVGEAPSAPPAAEDDQQKPTDQ